jgi:branched-chain amino acid transport system substrate-binding protein
MRRITAAAVALTLLATPALAADKLKIGFVTTLTTGMGYIGEDMRRAIDVAVDHIGGRIAGREVEVIVEDDGLKPEIGKQKTEKLVQKDKVDIVTGYIWSHVLLASYKTVVDSGLFLISANAGPSQLAGSLCHENFFSTSWQNDQTPMAMGEVLNQRGVKSLYVMAPNYAAGKDMVGGVERTYKGSIVAKDLTQFPDQLDFSAELSKVRAAKPDALFAFYPGGHGTQFFKQFQQSGLQGTVPLYTAFTVDGANLPVLKDQAVGSLTTQFWSPDLDNSVNKRFVADFRKLVGHDPTFYAAQTYDAIMLIKHAVEAVDGDLSKQAEMRAVMKKADFGSVRGAFRYGNNHFPIQNFYLLEVVADGKDGFTTRTVSTVFKDHQDAYAGECAMK